ncbi:branched-chain amino acid ABC transporter permease [Halobacteriales archaeon QS_8_69_26]|nr:MAG: branched-chain amino acid ABC transporter permease [Halobacteriales archaeon QS_8_69_26]
MATDADEADPGEGSGPLGATTDVGGGDPLAGEPWYRRYLWDHRVHAAVVVLFALYPFAYSGLTEAMPATMTTLLPGITVMVGVLYFGLFAMSFDFVSGYTGYLDFGHAAFYGIGAYFVILVANDKVPLLDPSTPFMFSLVIAGLLAALVALVIGAVSFRLTGVYFAMITLGFAQVIYVLMSNWDYLGDNPRSGIAVNTSMHPEGFEVGVPFVDALNMQIASANFVGETLSTELAGHVIALSAPEVSYFMIGLVVGFCYFAMQRVIHSPFGKVMIAIRENEERAEAIGYDTFKYKMGAFAISAFFAAVGGALFAGYRRSVDPDNSLFFLVAGDALLAAIIGGFGTLAGALFGFLFFEFLGELLANNFVSRGGESVPDGLLPYLRDVLGEGTLSTTLFGDVTVRTVLDVLFNGRAELYIGVLFVLFVLYVPNGILGTLRLWLGGTVAKKLPERIGSRLRGGQADPGPPDD